MNVNPASLNFGPVHARFLGYDGASMLLVSEIKGADLAVEDLKEYISFIEKHAEPELRKAALKLDKEAALAMLKSKYSDFETVCETGSAEVLT